jgi:phosphonopyruvate decarboxylase
MLEPADFVKALADVGIDHYVGVPDSLLKSLCQYVSDHGNGCNHTICANEGAAVAMAIGHHLATGSIAAVYMQNSGLGNAVNPLLSLADPEVYSVPLLMIIGWRGTAGRQG